MLAGGVAALTAASLLLACGSGAHRHAVPTSGSPAGEGQNRKPPDVTPAMRMLWAALNRLLAEAGPDSGAVVYDLHDRDQIYSLRAATKRPPASVEKLYTTVAILKKLGPDVRLHTNVRGGGQLGSKGIWHGDLYLQGGGDPTLGDGTFNRVWEQGYGPTAQELAQQLSNRGIRKVTGAVIADPYLFDLHPGGPATGFASDVPDYGGQLSALTYDHGSTAGGLTPAAFAAKELALALHSLHVQSSASPTTGHTAQGAPLLASVSSPPMSVLLRLMDTNSDDLFADLLTKQLGVRFGSGGSLGSGARVIEQVISSYGLHPAIFDGSGLDRSDSSSPHEVLALLKTVWNTPVGDRLHRALPVVGVNGTVKTIGDGTAAQGRCTAKTGTLDSVTNLAGYCQSRGGHELAFVLFLDGTPNYKALRLIGQMVAAIARY